ncbi:MAG: hypothetical protein AB7L92_01075 [Alphaproteobacteria bacterium]
MQTTMIVYAFLSKGYHMKNRILLTCAFVAISTAAIAQATTTGITTRNAENGGFTIKRGDEVNVKGCNGGSGSSGCKDAKQKTAM